MSILEQKIIDTHHHLWDPASKKYDWLVAPGHEVFNNVYSVNDLKKHGFGKNPLFKCIVAEIENQIVGMALFYPRYSTWRGPTIHLEDLIVKEKWKSNGIGRALYKEFIQYAFSQKVRRVEWVVLDWNKNAIDFYNISGAKVLQDWRTVQMDYETMDKYLKNIN